MTATAELPKITYGIANIKSYEASYDEQGNVASLVIDDKIEAKPTDRFWTSLCCQFSSYGLSPKLFKLFTHREVFDRLHDRLPEHGGEMRYTVENGNMLLALSRPTKPFMPFNETYDLLSRHGLSKPTYSRGMIRTEHAPAHMTDFKVGPDEFSHRYITEVPIDGFSLPAMYLSLLRAVCTNGAIAMSPAFRSSVPIGKDEDNTVLALGRSLDSFNNEEGYAALRQRFDAASNSWASIRECQKAYAIMAKLADKGALTMDGKLAANVVVEADGRLTEYDAPNRSHGWTYERTFNGRKGMLDELCTRRSIARRVSEDGITMREKINRAYLQMSGDIVDLYKLTSVDSLTDKKQSQLPSKCSVFDLINLCTELSTHYATAPSAVRPLEAHVGDLVSGEYDLEGTKAAKPTWQDWYLDASTN